MSAALMPVCQSGSAPWPASEDVAVSRMTVRGTRVWMAYRPDRGEWRLSRLSHHVGEDLQNDTFLRR